jgi:hypothetical protein
MSRNEKETREISSYENEKLATYYIYSGKKPHRASIKKGGTRGKAGVKMNFQNFS